MDYRDLESFILGELDNKDSLFQQRDKTTTTANNIRNHNNNKIITVRDSNQNLYSVTKNVTESLTPPQPCTVISRNPNGSHGGEIKLKLTDHDLHQPSAEDFFTSVIKETSTAVITSVPQPYVERDASDDFFAIKSPVHRISTAAENAAVDGYREPANNAMFSKDPAVDINNSGSGSANDVFSKDPTTDFFHSSSSSHEDFSITTEPTTEINETLEQALFR